jgi:hypothetical protein
MKITESKGSNPNWRCALKRWRGNVALNRELDAVADYTARLGDLLMGFKPTVKFFDNKSVRAVATYGSKTISFNLAHLGHRWFNLTDNRLAIDDLIIHEFGHEYAANHLSEAYNDALSSLAARAMQLGRLGKLP